MRDEILKGQCAICKTVINGHASPIIPDYLCLDCDDHNWVTGKNPKRVMALEYPTGVLEDMPPFVVLEGVIQARRAALEKLAADYWGNMGFIVSYCPENMTLDKWVMFLRLLGMQATVTRQAPRPHYMGYEKIIFSMFELPGIHDPYVFASEKWKNGSVVPGKKES
jgi:hypothetical protein